MTMTRAPASPVLMDLARGLGWFSVAVGTAEALAPRALTHAMGLHGRGRMVRLFGVREVVTGIGVLAADDPTPWIKGRVGGDALDLATLMAGLLATRRPRSLLAGLLMVLGVTALDVLCNNELERGKEEARRPVIDYGDRGGFPKSPAEMRGVARSQSASA